MFALHLMAKRSDTASRNIAIAASTKAGSWRLGLLVVSTMQDSTVRANLISYNSAAGSVEWAMAMWLTGRMGQPGKDRQWATGSISTATFNIDKRDVVGLNAVLTAAGNNWSQAMSLLARAPCARLQVNIRCFTGAPQCMWKNHILAKGDQRTGLDISGQSTWQWSCKKWHRTRQKVHEHFD